MSHCQNYVISHSGPRTSRGKRFLWLMSSGEEYRVETQLSGCCRGERRRLTCLFYAPSQVFSVSSQTLPLSPGPHIFVCTRALSVIYTSDHESKVERQMLCPKRWLLLFNVLRVATFLLQCNMLGWFQWSPPELKTMRAEIERIIEIKSPNR